MRNLLFTVVLVVCLGSFAEVRSIKVQVPDPKVDMVLVFDESQSMFAGKMYQNMFRHIKSWIEKYMKEGETSVAVIGCSEKEPVLKLNQGVSKKDVDGAIEKVIRFIDKNGNKTDNRDNCFVMVANEVYAKNVGERADVKIVFIYISDCRDATLRQPNASTIAQLNKNHSEPFIICVKTVKIKKPDYKYSAKVEKQWRNTMVKWVKNDPTRIIEYDGDEAQLHKSIDEKFPKIEVEIEEGKKEDASNPLLFIITGIIIFLLILALVIFFLSCRGKKVAEPKKSSKSDSIIGKAKSESVGSGKQIKEKSENIKVDLTMAGKQSRMSRSSKMGGTSKVCSKIGKDSSSKLSKASKAAKK